MPVSSSSTAILRQSLMPDFSTLERLTAGYSCLQPRAQQKEMEHQERFSCG